MIKQLLFATFVAAATAFQLSDVPDEVRIQTAEVDSIVTATETINGKTSQMMKEFAEISTATKNVDDMFSEVAEVDGDASGLPELMEAMEQTAKKKMNSKVEAYSTESKAKIDDAIAKIQRALRAAKSNFDMKKSNIEATQSDLGTLEAHIGSVEKRVDSHAECNKKGELYDVTTEKCVGVQVSASKSIPHMGHRMFNNGDGRDSGYVSNRHANFKKKYDDTFLRIYYHDNMRVHGHTAHGRWNIMICDPNGNACGDCTEPGRLQYWRYARHQHNWWMNDHWGGAIHGLCKKTNQRDLTKGEYRIMVRIDNNRYDIYTGHSQHNSIMVEEVFVNDN